MCRFAGIEGGHPYPGDFHTKQNYYDEKKPDAVDNVKKNSKSKDSGTKVGKSIGKSKAHLGNTSKSNDWKPAGSAVGWGNAAPDVKEGTDPGEWEGGPPSGADWGSPVMSQSGW